LLHYLPHILIAAIVLAAFVMVWRTEGDDPLWQERWRALSPTEQARIAAAARSGSLLASEEEIELAAGFARRDRRRRGPYTLIYAIRLPLGIALVAGGLVADSIVFIVFGVLFILVGLWSLGSERRVARAEREAIDRARNY
jgi:hypothetical protein